MAITVFCQMFIGRSVAGSIQLPTSGYNGPSWGVGQIGANARTANGSQQTTSGTGPYGPGVNPSAQTAFADVGAASATASNSGSFTFDGSNSLTINGSADASASAQTPSNNTSGGYARGGWGFSGLGITTGTWAQLSVSLSIQDSTGNYFNSQDPYATTNFLFAGHANSVRSSFSVESNHQPADQVGPNFSIVEPIFLPSAFDYIFSCDLQASADAGGLVANTSASARVQANITLLPDVNITPGPSYHFAPSGAATGGTNIVGGVTINAGGVGIVDAPTGGGRQVFVPAGGLAIAGSMGHWTGLLDLGANDLVVAGASLGTVTDQIAQGFNATGGGKWDGTGGIVSSTAAADSTNLTAIGVMQNNQSGSALYSSSNLFNGYAPGASDILAKYTYFGDANLDGKVDGSDYSLIDNGYLQGLTGWYNGDFNYDNVIDGSDYTLIDNAFNRQGAALTAEVATAIAELPLSAVPEPIGLSLLSLGSVALLGRARRKS